MRFKRKELWLNIKKVFKEVLKEEVDLEFQGYL
jgi:hypothetical protein